MEAWESLSEDQYRAVWDRFYQHFDFRPSTHLDMWPSIREPKPSITYQFIDYPSEELVDDVNAKSLIAFRSVVSPEDVLYALDWQHECYWFRPFVPFGKWQIPVFPEGEYSIFLARDFSFGIFGHPWEQTFCVWGDKLLAAFEDSMPVIFDTIIRQNNQD